MAYLFILALLFPYSNVFSQELNCESPEVQSRRKSLMDLKASLKTLIDVSDEEYNKITEETNSLLSKKGHHVLFLLSSSGATLYPASKLFPSYVKLLSRLPYLGQIDQIHIHGPQMNCIILNQRLTRLGERVANGSALAGGISLTVLNNQIYKYLQKDSLQLAKEMNEVQKKVAKTIGAPPDQILSLQDLVAAIDKFEEERKLSIQSFEKTAAEYREKITQSTKSPLVNDRHRKIVERRIYLGRFKLYESQLTFVELLMKSLEEKCPDKQRI